MSSCEKLTEDIIQAYLVNRDEWSKEDVTFETLDGLFPKKLRINMPDLATESRIENLFAPYHSVLRLNDVSWVFEDNQNVNVYHAILVI